MEGQHTYCSKFNCSPSELLRLSVLVTGEQSVCRAGRSTPITKSTRREGNLGFVPRLP
jgi:hypothetical protein